MSIKPIHLLKREAKDYKKLNGCSYSEALKFIASKNGFNSWSLLIAKHDEHLPESKFEILEYIQEGDIVLLGARPAVGKTTVSLQFALESSIKGNHVYLFSAELTAINIADRISKINKYRDSKNQIQSDYSIINFSDNLKKISNIPIFINDKSNLSFNSILNAITEIEITPGSLIIIDHLQLLSLDSNYDRRPKTIMQAIERLNYFAKERKLKIIVLTQLKKNLEERVNKKPQIGDIREPLSGGICQFFNKIMFLYREGIYNPKVNKEVLEIIFKKPKEHTVKTSFEVH